MPLTRADALSQYDQDYAKGWVQHSDSMETGGIYSKASEMLQPTSGLHVDLGSGIGQLLYELNTQNPALTVIGVDNNRHLANGSRIALGHGGINVLEGSKITDRQSPDGRVLQKFRKNGKVRSRVMLRSGQVSIVCDDIRSMQILKEILTDKKIDSGSLMFPGGSVRLALEHRSDFNVGEDELKKKQMQVMQRVRAAAGKFFTECVKTGGKVLLAERYGLDDPADLDASVVQAFRQVFVDNHKRWDIDDTKIFVVSGTYKPATGPNNMVTHSFSENSGVELIANTADAPANTNMYIVMSTWRKK